MSNKLEPGDFCKIVDHPKWIRDSKSKRLGQIVLLSERYGVTDLIWGMRWKIVGGDAKTAISEYILEKIPPPPQLNEDEEEDLELCS
jgi:hypothetical protein